MRAPSRLTLVAMACVLAAGCASKRGAGTPDDEPRISSLTRREVRIDKDAGIPSNEEKAIAAYRQFLDAAPKAPQRSEALRRLGDLEMDHADQRSAQAGADPDYKAAVARYEEYLRAYPNDPRNDRVLYQLARAQEQGGQLDVALKTLDRLVSQYPGTPFEDEAQFRRGELLFATREYAKAEAAYATVLKGGRDNPYRERALYMQGWSLFKQGRLEEGLHAFFGVLDGRMAHRGGEELESLKGLSRADRELVEDTFRVASISFANLQGAESIPAYITSRERESYEFRVYQQLAELYLKQERTKDAADTLGAFARRQPLHEKAPVLQARVIEIYQQAGFGMLALEAKKEYVSRYGVDSEFRKANPMGWEAAQPLIKTHLTELAQHHHAVAQKSKASADYQEAVRWYRLYLTSFPQDPSAAHNNFLLAELLYEDQRFAEAAAEYEKTAYGYPAHDKSAEAGYAALLAYAEQDKRADAAARPALHKASVASALRFADGFPKDARAGAVLTNAAEKLFALREADAAADVAQRVLKLDPPATAEQRRVAWTVVAHTAFDRKEFKDAERAYGEVLGLTPEKDAARNDLVERMAAAVYKQGEQAREKGDARDAVAHFARVAAVAPQSSVRATAQYDAAAALIGLKDWAAASRLLEDFRQRYPQHPLNEDVSTKLAAAYLEQQQWAPAAAEFERIAATRKDPEVSRTALWQAAELYEKAGARVPAAKAYERYLAQHPQPLETAVEARWRLAQMAKAGGDARRELALMKDLFQADQAGGAARTDRTRFLGASAALALAQPVLDNYRKVQLVEPLARQLKLKKARMEEVLKAYAVAADYGVANVTTAATFHTAALYQDFGKALMSSQRPKRLSKAELEQYNVMLEEQAFPFEEKAMELHEVNARRTAQGVYDEWVQASFKALAQLRPARYGKAERGAEVPAHPSAEQIAALEQAAAAQPRQGAGFNRLAVAYRQQGQFDKARQAYEQAIAAEPQYAPALLNLGVLYDIYLWDGAKALELYERYLALTPGGDAQVGKWVADLKNRKPAGAVARKEGT
ncbi:MAG: tetratricopeptide repeat protein [Pseudomonadota bacterium]